MKKKNIFWGVLGQIIKHPFITWLIGFGILICVGNIFQKKYHVSGEFNFVGLIIFVLAIMLLIIALSIYSNQEGWIRYVREDDFGKNAFLIRHKEGVFLESSRSILWVDDDSTINKIYLGALGYDGQKVIDTMIILNDLERKYHLLVKINIFNLSKEIDLNEITKILPLMKGEESLEDFIERKFLEGIEKDSIIDLFLKLNSGDLSKTSFLSKVSKKIHFPEVCKFKNFKEVKLVFGSPVIKYYRTC